MKERWLRHDASLHFDSLVCGCLRGGGLQPEQQSRGSEPPAENGGLLLVLQDTDSYTGLVGEAGLSGMVGGSSYTAARTRGDGTCGLHALFGTCVGGELYAASVRSRLQQLLPKDLGTVLANASVNGRRALGGSIGTVAPRRDADRQKDCGGS